MCLRPGVLADSDQVDEGIHLRKLDSRLNGTGVGAWGHLSCLPSSSSAFPTLLSCASLALMDAPYAFVTLVTSDHYLPGALAVAAALKDLHPFPAVPPEVPFQTICLVTPESVDVSTIKLLRRAFDVVIGVEIIEQEDGSALQLLGESGSLKAPVDSWCRYVGNHRRLRVLRSTMACTHMQLFCRYERRVKLHAGIVVYASGDTRGHRI